MQRQIQVERKVQEQESLMEASEYNPKIMYKVIAKQRSTSVAVDLFNFDGEIVTGSKLVSRWSRHFKDLATPKHDEAFDDDFRSRVESRHIVLQSLNHDIVDNVPIDINIDVVEAKIRGLKTGKAADIYGIAAEHLKYADPSVINILTKLLKTIVTTKSIPTQLKTGIITPVFKNKGDPNLPTNYRRITVTSIIGKILEKIMVDYTKEILTPQLNRLQRGFCTSASSINTSFILSETLAHAKDAGDPLHYMFLDASKAFDVVWHDSLLNKINDLGIRGDLWLLYKSLYTDMTSKVK